MASDDAVRFSFGPRDRRGLIAGVRTGQLVLLACCLVGAVALARHGSTAALAGAVGVILAGVTLGWLPISGRTPEEWFPVCVRHLLRAVRQSTSSRSNQRSNRVAPAQRASRPLYAGLELLQAVGNAGDPVGVVFDHKSGTASAALSFGGASFALLDDAERLQRVAAWSGVLASCAEQSGTIHRLQWVERSLPSGRPADAAPESSAWLASERQIAEDDQTAATLSARASYEALLRAERGTGVHELFVVLSVRTTRSARAGLPKETTRRLISELASLERRCSAAGLACEGPLSKHALGSALRRAGEGRPQTGLGCGPPWPELGETRWSSVRAGAIWHTTYWISEWPRHDVASDFLVPMLVLSDCRRSLSLVMAPLAPVRAVRAAEHARTAKAADAALRSRHGFALTARSRREEDAVLRREAELAAGHAGYRFSGYLTVSADSPPALNEARRRVEQAAALCRLELRRLDGEQDEAFLCALPIARGCT